jgi:L-iditol 2-dehydrogenase
VAVMGLGPIGLMFVRMAKVLGCRVIAIGRRQSQLANAGRLGADEFVIARDDNDAIVERVHELTDSHGVDIAIEAVGKPQSWELAVRLLRRGGTVNFFGGCPSDTRISLDTQLLHYSELTCTASFHFRPAHVRQALAHIAAGDITAQQFVNREEPLARLLEVMQQLMAHNGHMKTAIIP